MAGTLLVSLAGAQPCEPTPTRHAARIVVPLDDAGATGGSPEVRGDRDFYQDVADRWVFALVHREYGWSIAIFEKDSSDSMDLSVVTPPYQQAPNPRDLFGWHFRNADNTGPNRGDVNAPQREREFFFATSAEKANPFVHAEDPGEVRLAEPDMDDGRGWLRVLDFGLADLERGEKARMNYLHFEACLTWPKSPEEIAAEADAADLRFLPGELATFAKFGLDLATYDLDARFAPRMLSGDVDGDGAADLLAPIRRKSDGKRGVAICRSGTSLAILGMDGRTIGEALQPDFFDRVEAWRLVPRDGGPFGHDGEPAWPDPDGDVLVLERIEKEIVLLYWKYAGFHSQQVYRMVEPYPAPANR